MKNLSDIDADGLHLLLGKPFKPYQCTKTTYPSGAVAGDIVFVTDATTPCLARYDGTNWKVLAAVGATVA